MRPSSWSSCLPVLTALRCPGQDRSLPVTRPAQPSDFSIFQRYLVPTAGVRESCSLRGGIQPPLAHALCAQNISSISLLHASRKPFFGRKRNWRRSLWRANGSAGDAFGKAALKAIGPSPLPGRWPSDPYKASHWPPKCSPRSCPCGPRLLVEASESPLDVRRSAPHCGATLERY